MADLVLYGARLFDGGRWHQNAALAVAGGRIVAVGGEMPDAAEVIDAAGLVLIPGFIDLQVNGGGGINFNDDPSAETIARIAAAHARFGTTALLATLITDRREARTAAIAAGRVARAAAVPGFLGLHLEGPHLSLAKKGVHDGRFIRSMEESDVAELAGAVRDLGTVMVTLAPEQATAEQVRRLAAAGAVISLGHSDCDYETALAYVAAGARCATHLFNAMSPLAHRAPGLVGAALEAGIFAGLIADGIHVHPAAMRLALRAKRGPGRLFLVTDAMLPLGTDLAEFQLNGRRILRGNGRLTLEDGTLAGADIDMLAEVRLARDHLDIGLDEAIRMATVHPAEAIGVADRKGRLAAGLDADFLLLTPDLRMVATYIAGRRVHST